MSIKGWFKFVVTTFVLMCAFGIVYFMPNLDVKPAVTTQFPNKIQPIKTPITNLPNVIQKTIPSVVHIKASAGWQGSGFIIAEDIIVTARHCVEDGGNFTITYNDGHKTTTNKSIYSKKYDVGFIKIESPIDIKLKPVTFGDVRKCKLGQFVFIIGSPLGDRHFNSVSFGIISNLDLSLESKGCPDSMGWSLLWMTDAASYGGSSGSPVFGLDGVVYGVLVGGYGDFESTSYCVPVYQFANDLENIKLLFALDKYQVEKEKEEPVYVYMEQVK